MGCRSRDQLSLLGEECRPDSRKRRKSSLRENILANQEVFLDSHSSISRLLSERAKQKGISSAGVNCTATSSHSSVGMTTSTVDNEVTKLSLPSTANGQETSSCKKAKSAKMLQSFLKWGSLLYFCHGFQGFMVINLSFPLGLNALHRDRKRVDWFAFTIFAANGACLIQDVFFPFENFIFT